MMDIVVTTLGGAFGTLAFGILYHVNPRHLLLSFFGGVITTLSLVLCLDWFDGNNLISNAVAAFAGGVYCTLCAHKRHAPVPVFMIPSLFPLVPGRALYYSMAGLVVHDGAQFSENFSAAAEISFGIAVGMMFANVFCDVYISCHRRRR